VLEAGDAGRGPLGCLRAACTRQPREHDQVMHVVVR
jgi:hypothetical protein